MKDIAEITAQLDKRIEALKNNLAQAGRLLVVLETIKLRKRVDNTLRTKYHELYPEAEGDIVQLRETVSGWHDIEVWCGAKDWDNRLRVTVQKPEDQLVWADFIASCTAKIEGITKAITDLQAEKDFLPFLNTLQAQATKLKQQALERAPGGLFSDIVMAAFPFLNR